MLHELGRRECTSVIDRKARGNESTRKNKMYVGG
jgi:hypothetical protein